MLYLPLISPPTASEFASLPPLVSFFSIISFLIDGFRQAICFWPVPSPDLLNAPPSVVICSDLSRTTALQLPGWWRFPSFSHQPYPPPLFIVSLILNHPYSASSSDEYSSAAKKRTSAQFNVADIESDRRRWWLSNRNEETIWSDLKRLILHTGLGSEMLKI